VELPVADIDLIAKTDPTLTATVVARRSIRHHDDERPLTLDQLAEFLARVQLAKNIRADDDGQELVGRPYPCGGGIGELEVYPLVQRCAGLAPGLYHYDSVGHRLELMPGGRPAARVVAYARAAAAMAGQPQVVLVVTARVQRLMWKYEGMSYAMVLKHTGVLTELMYLVATAMNLAPCALGAGDATAFAALSGLDPLVEPSVADFLLGSRLASDGDGVVGRTEER
jgi:SagB-type dehydrogenase family enzyme